MTDDDKTRVFIIPKKESLSTDPKEVLNEPTLAPAAPKTPAVTSPAITIPAITTPAVTIPGVTIPKEKTKVVTPPTDSNTTPNIVLDLEEATGAIDLAKIYEKNFAAKENSTIFESPPTIPDVKNILFKDTTVSIPNKKITPEKPPEIILNFDKTGSFDISALKEKKKTQLFEMAPIAKEDKTEDKRLIVEKEKTKAQQYKISPNNETEDNLPYVEKIEMVTLNNKSEKTSQVKEKKLSLDIGYTRNVKNKVAKNNSPEVNKNDVTTTKANVTKSGRLSEEKVEEKNIEKSQISSTENMNADPSANPQDIVLKFDETTMMSVNKTATHELEFPDKKLSLDYQRTSKNSIKVTPVASRLKKQKKEQELGSLFKRFIALFLDLFVALVVFILSAFLVPFATKTSQDVLDLLHMKFTYGPSTTSVIIHALLFVVDMFIVFALFLSYTNTSVGKKALGLSIRGKYQYELSVSQALLRELIFKPLSLISVVGGLWAFVDKEKRSLHDILSATLVIETPDDE